MERLNKIIARSGVCSRRKADELISKGFVKVNNEVITELGFKVKKEDNVIVNNIPLSKENKVYYILNKPKNIICSANDEKGRITVIDLAKNAGITERIFPVGRLDFNTDGLIILTNDGNLTNYLTHPKNEIEKEYKVKINNIMPRHKLKELQLKKFVLYENKKYCFKKINIISYNKETKTTTLTITLTSGLNHHVRNLFKALNYEVLSLTRIRIKNLKIEDVKKGSIRELKIHELKELKENI